jgi:hypothetical protein
MLVTLVGLATTSAGAKEPKAEEQVAVLLKWYHDYFENGKYPQAQEIAETAYKLAPDDPRTLAAVKVARRQQGEMAQKEKVDHKLDKVLSKLEQLEQHVRELQTEKQRLEKLVQALQARNERLTRRIQPSREEPRGSPDRID